MKVSYKWKQRTHFVLQAKKTYLLMNIGEVNKIRKNDSVTLFLKSRLIL